MCSSMLNHGRCDNELCNFAHSEAELRATDDFFKMKMCNFAAVGRCKFGSACRFAHSKDELRHQKEQQQEVVAESNEPQSQLSRFSFVHQMAPLWSEGMAPLPQDGFLDSPSCFVESPRSSNREAAPTALPSSGGSEATDSSFDNNPPWAELDTQKQSNDHCLAAGVAHREAPVKQVNHPQTNTCLGHLAQIPSQHCPDMVGRQTIQGYVPVLFWAPMPWAPMHEGTPSADASETLATATNSA